MSYVCERYTNDTWESSLDSVSRLTYEDLKRLVYETQDLHFSGEERYYAIIDTLDGGRVLAIKFQNLGIYAPEDDSFALFVLAARDGELYLTYAVDSWARSYSEICENLMISGYGSAGAGDSFSWYGFVDKNGQYISLYSMETLYDDWIAMYDYEDFGIEETSWAQGNIFYLLSTQEGGFYACELSEDIVAEKLDTFTHFLEEKGMIYISSPEDKIQESYEKYGIENKERQSFDGWTLIK